LIWKKGKKKKKSECLMFLAGIVLCGHAWKGGDFVYWGEVSIWFLGWGEKKMERTFLKKLGQEKK